MKYITYILLLFFVFVINNNAYTSDNSLDAFGYFYIENYKLAEDYFNKAISENSHQNDKLLLYRGITRIKLQKYEAAEQDLFEAFNMGQIQAALELARLYAKTSYYDDAFKYLQQYLSGNNLVNTDILKKDPDLLLLSSDNRWFDLWQKKWELPEIEIIREAQFMAKNGEFQKAIELLNKKSITVENKALLLNEKGEIYNQIGEFALAANSFYSATSNDNKSITYQINYCEALLKTKKFEKAVEVGSIIIRQSSEQFKIYLVRAEANLALNKYSDAEKDVKLYLKYFPESTEAQILSAKVLVASGKKMEALKQFNKLLSENQTAELFKERGLIYYKTRTYQYAFEDLSMSLDLDPTDGEVYLYYGLSLLQLGKKDKACYAFRKAYSYGELTALEYIKSNNCPD